MALGYLPPLEWDGIEKRKIGNLPRARIFQSSRGPLVGPPDAGGKKGIECEGLSSIP